MNIEDLWARLDFISEGNEAGLGTLQLVETDFSTRHGQVLAGLGDSKHQHLLIPTARESELRSDTDSQGIHIRERRLLDDNSAEQFFVDIECRIASLENLFTSVVEDMLRTLQNERPEDPFVTCVEVLQRWRHLLRTESNRLLSKSAIIGLLTELRILQGLLESSIDGADQWKGPEGRRHDFVLDDFSIEAKSTTRQEGWYAKINGINQLTTESSTPLYLAVSKYQESEDGELTLPAVIDEILEMPIDSGRLFDGLSEAGYLAVDEDTYRQIRFDLIDERIFEVRDDFPRLTPEQIEGDLSERVQKVRYEIDLNELDELRIASSIDEFLQHLGAQYD